MTEEVRVTHRADDAAHQREHGRDQEVRHHRGLLLLRLLVAPRSTAVVLVTSCGSSASSRLRLRSWSRSFSSSWSRAVVISPSEVVATNSGLSGPGVDSDR